MRACLSILALAAALALVPAATSQAQDSTERELEQYRQMMDELAYGK